MAEKTYSNKQNQNSIKIITLKVNIRMLKVKVITDHSKIQFQNLR